MADEIIIRPSVPADAQMVGKLTHAMECELWPNKATSLDETHFVAAARELLYNNRGLWAFVACLPSGKMIGMLTLNECTALYAGGPFGEIADFYIVPAHRSFGIGSRLVDAAATFGRERFWPIIEVGAPAQTRWKRTFDFYRRKGFREIGPRLELSL